MNENMNPIAYYALVKKYLKWRAPFAAMATFARFSEAEEIFWDHVQNISDWLKEVRQYDVAMLAPEDEGYQYIYSEPVYSNSICSDCRNLRWIDPDNFMAECEMAKLGVEWPGRTNDDGDITACPDFVPEDYRVRTEGGIS